MPAKKKDGIKREEKRQMKQHKITQFGGSEFWGMGTKLGKTILY